jgi:kynurenine 3-monooxygenase
MRDLVNSRWFLFRKKLDNLLHALMPTTFIPLYTMVTFSQIPYATVIAKHKAQAAAVGLAWSRKQTLLGTRVSAATANPLPDRLPRCRWTPRCWAWALPQGPWPRSPWRVSCSRRPCRRVRGGGRGRG